jgi:hypothetical protein
VARDADEKAIRDNSPPLARIDAASRQVHAVCSSGQCHIDPAVDQNARRRGCREIDGFAYQRQQFPGGEVFLTDLDQIYADGDRALDAL